MKFQFSITQEQWNIRNVVLLLLTAFAFSIYLKYTWVSMFNNVESFKWLNQLMINTNDGYYFAEGARDILNGGIHQKNDSSPIDNPLSQLTAILVQILPFTFEQIIFWMPAVFGSLILIPVFLIGQSLRLPLMGAVAAFLAPIVWSYYNRTMVGYYDTDMLTIVLPMFVLWGMIEVVHNKRENYLLAAPIFAILYYLWYPQGASLLLAFVGILGIYTLIFDRKEILNYKLITLLAFAVVPWGFPYAFVVKLLIVFAIYGLLHYLEAKTTSSDNTEKDDKTVVLKKDEVKVKRNLWPVIFALIGISIGMLIAAGAFDSIYAQVRSYIFRENPEEAKLHFYNVVKTVREASSIPWEVFVNRISGHEVIFWVSTIGVALLIMSFRSMLLAIPMVGLGFLAYKNGLRFTVYAVPIYALGFGYIVTLFVENIKQKPVRYAVAAAITLLAIYPNWKHIENYKVPVVFNKNEVAVLDKLKHIAKRNDYVLAWWDYGYPIRFYSDVKTYIDGGAHSGGINFFVSYSLMRDPISSARMARLAAEYRESKGMDLETMMNDYNIDDPDEFLAKLQQGQLELPKKTMDIYYYLPLRMMNIFPTVGLFSQVDLHTGEQKIKPFFYQTSSFRDTGRYIELGNGLKFDKEKALLEIGKNRRPVDFFFITEYKKDGKLHVTALQSRAGANFSIIFMKSYNKLLVVDRYTLMSTYIQLFVLENYPTNFYEPVILTPLAKVYKLKI